MAIHSSVSTLEETTDGMLGKTLLLPAERGGMRVRDVPQFLLGVQVGVKEEVHGQLEALLGHRLVVRVLQLRLFAQNRC